MSFDESLRRIVNNIEDASGIALVGMDGIVVEEHKKDPMLDLPSVGAECCTIVKEVEKVAESLRLGSMDDLSFATEKGMILIRRINRDYFLVLAIGSEGNFGKGRYLIKREIPILEKEL
jgi:predicted regulator of Ras-like GTPase activity (Roadblock/LC7/MglB family)